MVTQRCTDIFMVYRDLATLDTGELCSKSACGARLPNQHNFKVEAQYG